MGTGFLFLPLLQKKSIKPSGHWNQFQKFVRNALQKLKLVSVFALLLSKLNFVGGDESFKEFIYDSILPACFLAPLKPTFDLNDSQTCLVCHKRQFFFFFGFAV